MLNLVAPTNGACNVIPGLGSGKITLTGSTYSVSGYGGNFNCTEPAALTFTNVPLNTCTVSNSGQGYVMLSTTLTITGTYFGAACEGAPIGGALPSVNAVGSVGRPACTTSGASSISIALLPGATPTFALAGFQAPGCNGTAASSWTAVPGTGCTANAIVSVKTGGTGAALPAPASASPTPAPAAASPAPTPSAASPAPMPATVPSPSPLPAKQYVALLGVYSDAACATLYPGVAKLDAIGTVGECSGLPGLGSGLITATPGAPAGTFDVLGYAQTTACATAPLAVWRSAKLGVCTASQATPLPHIYVMLSSTLVVKSVSGGAECSRAGGMLLTNATVVAVGTGGSASCTRLNTLDGAPSSLSVLGTSATTYNLVGYPASATCSGFAAATWSNASAGACSASAVGSAASLSVALGGLASGALPAAAGEAAASGPTALALGLGLGLGLGVPVVAALLYFSGAFAVKAAAGGAQASAAALTKAPIAASAV